MIKLCKSCEHYKNLGAGESGKACHYILDTGKPRGCAPVDCDKWTLRSKKPKTEGFDDVRIVEV